MRSLNMALISAAITLATLLSALGAMAIPASATSDEDPASKGLEKADDNVHENAPQNDVKFHEGTCQGGHTTEALEEIASCDEPPITDPGNSDDHRNDD
jgi:uncharacterized membrane protein